MSTWQLVAIFAGGVGCGIALGWLAGHSLGFYFGRRLERKRLARLLANKTAIEVVQTLLKTGTIGSIRPDKVGTPRDETRH